MKRVTRGSGLVILALCGMIAACTETDDVFRDIGTARLFFTDPGLRSQGFTDPETRIQAAGWEIQSADFDLDGMPLDLVFDEPCSYSDSYLIVSAGEGKCAGGIVLGTNEDPIPVTLGVTFTMQVKRARPLVLPDEGDFDGDGRRNDVDNCVLVDNPDQQDLDGNLVGDTCSLIDPFTGGVSRDSDVDGVPDTIDNCLWVPNPRQEDSSGNLPDGIGDACTEEVADVVDALGNLEIRAELGPVDLVQLLGVATYLTVDLDNTEFLDCDWSAGRCVLLIDPDLLPFCVRTDPLSASGGCF